MPNRTTRDYEGPSVAPRVQAALDAALQDEDDIDIDGRWNSLFVALYLRSFVVLGGFFCENWVTPVAAKGEDVNVFKFGECVKIRQHGVGVWGEIFFIWKLSNSTGSRWWGSVRERFQNVKCLCTFGRVTRWWKNYKLKMCKWQKRRITVICSSVQLLGCKKSQIEFPSNTFQMFVSIENHPTSRLVEYSGCTRSHWASASIFWRH